MTAQQNRLARSFFSFALLTWLVASVACVQLLLAPASPDALFQQLRGGIMVGAGGLWLATLAVCVWALRADDARLGRVAVAIEAFFAPVWRVVLVVGVLFVLNVGAGSALRDVAPPIVAPLRLWMGGWSLVVLLALFTATWASLMLWVAHTRATWVTIGLGVSVLAGVLAGAWAVNTLIGITGINDALRGGLDYRALDFIPDGAIPSSAAFWQEQSKTRVRWLPYSYWTVTPLDGDYINVDATGVRLTPHTAPPDAPSLAFFGGSTVWGEGARDAYTIPAQVAQRLTQVATPYRVTNYGQTGYVLTQDMLLFQMRLLNGDVPDVAVFYGGFNDLLAGYAQNITGITLQEFQRMNDAEVGRTLRGGQAVFAPYARPLERESIALVAPNDGTPTNVMARYLALTEMITRLAESYGVRVLFVWQPALVFKQPLVGGEVGAYERMESERAGFAQAHREADALLRAYVAAHPNAPFLVLSDLFMADERAIFYDLIHMTEVGNAVVADALLPALSELQSRGQ